MAKQEQVLVWGSFEERKLRMEEANGFCFSYFGRHFPVPWGSVSETEQTWVHIPKAAGSSRGAEQAEILTCFFFPSHIRCYFEASLPNVCSHPGDDGHYLKEVVLREPWVSLSICSIFSRLTAPWWIQLSKANGHRLGQHISCIYTISPNCWETLISKGFLSAGIPLLKNSFLLYFLFAQSRSINITFISSGEVTRWELNSSCVNTWLGLGPEEFPSLFYLSLGLGLESSSCCAI